MRRDVHDAAHLIAYVQEVGVVSRYTKRMLDAQRPEMRWTQSRVIVVSGPWLRFHFSLPNLQLSHCKVMAETSEKQRSKDKDGKSEESEGKCSRKRVAGPDPLRHLESRLQCRWDGENWQSDCPKAGEDAPQLEKEQQCPLSETVSWYVVDTSLGWKRP